MPGGGQGGLVVAEEKQEFDRRALPKARLWAAWRPQLAKFALCHPARAHDSVSAAPPTLPVVRVGPYQQSAPVKPRVSHAPPHGTMDSQSTQAFDCPQGQATSEAIVACMLAGDGSVRNSMARDAGSGEGSAARARVCRKPTPGTAGCSSPATTARTCASGRGTSDLGRGTGAGAESL